MRRTVVVRGLAGALAGVLVWVALAPASPVADLPTQVTAALPRIGVESAVTGVLLGVRAYDTLLEIAVLLLAMLAAGHESRPASGEPPPPASLVLRGFVNGLVPFMVLVAGYLLWAGTTRPGGAFQAGAVLAAAAVLLRLAGGLGGVNRERRAVRAGAAAGLAVFLVLGLLPLVSGGAWLGYREPFAHVAILAIESALTVTVALALVALFVSPPRPGPPP